MMMPDQCPSIVIGVEDIREAMDNVVNAVENYSGNLWKFRDTVVCFFYDTEGNRASIIQPLIKMQSSGQ